MLSTVTHNRCFVPLRWQFRFLGGLGGDVAIREISSNVMKEVVVSTLVPPVLGDQFVYAAVEISAGRQRANHHCMMFGRMLHTRQQAFAIGRRDVLQ